MKPNLRDEEVDIATAAFTLEGHLTVPANAAGIVIFAHGSGSSRHSPRNQEVAKELNRIGLATLLFDLLTLIEAEDRTNVFDIALLAERLVEATLWLQTNTELGDLPVGYFGASTGAAAALWAAGDLKEKVAAVVSRGGRADLAGSQLPKVTAATLLIVGGKDEVVIDLNRQAQVRLNCENDLVIVPGATHLFEEEGALEQVAKLAGDWFLRYLPH